MHCARSTTGLSTGSAVTRSVRWWRAKWPPCWSSAASARASWSVSIRRWPHGHASVSDDRTERVTLLKAMFPPAEADRVLAESPSDSEIDACLRRRMPAARLREVLDMRRTCLALLKSHRTAAAPAARVACLHAREPLLPTGMRTRCSIACRASKYPVITFQCSRSRTSPVSLRSFNPFVLNPAMTEPIYSPHIPHLAFEQHAAAALRSNRGPLGARKRDLR